MSDKTEQKRSALHRRTDTYESRNPSKHTDSQNGALSSNDIQTLQRTVGNQAIKSWASKNDIARTQQTSNQAQHSPVNLLQRRWPFRSRGSDNKKNPKTKEQSRWAPSNFSDPSKHNDTKKFRYIVMALQNETNNASTKQISSMNILDNPSLIQQMVNSTSVIDQDHRGTYTPYGLILRVPEQSVQVASKSDAGYSNRNDDPKGELEKAYDEHGLNKPKDILKDTRWKSSHGKGSRKLPYNEVIVADKSPAESKHQFTEDEITAKPDQDSLRKANSVEDKVTVTGIFIKVRQAPDGKTSRMKMIDGNAKDMPNAYVSDVLMERLEEFSAQLGVPIVNIVEPDPSHDKLKQHDPKPK